MGCPIPIRRTIHWAFLPITIFDWKRWISIGIMDFESEADLTFPMMIGMSLLAGQVSIHNQKHINLVMGEGLFPYWAFPQSIAGEFFDRAKGKWTLFLNMGDAVLGKDFYVGKNFFRYVPLSAPAPPGSIKNLKSTILSMPLLCRARRSAIPSRCHAITGV